MTETRLFGVVGHPVSHSLSPAIHSFWYDQLGINAAYEALDLVSDRAAQDIRSLAHFGYSGLNVTLPHKLSAFEAASDMSSAASTIGAINTLVLRSDSDDHRFWFGENTDWTGCLWSLDRIMDVLPGHAVLIGAGGAARAVAYALKTRGLELTLINRTEDKAYELASDLNLNVSRVTGLTELIDICTDADLVINTVSLGHSGGHLDLPKTTDGVFLDISYAQAAHATLTSANASGWTTEDGLPMLIGQAADAFKLWFGIEPDRETALQAMRKRLSA